MPITAIHLIQGSDLFSTFGGQTVTARGVVTGATRKGFFIQDPDGEVGNVSHGLFVYDRRRRPPVGSLVEVEGEVLNFQMDPEARPTTQLSERSTRVIADQGPVIEPFWLTAERVLVAPDQLAILLNSLEGMLVGVPAGSIFVAPSNAFGDYVVIPPGADLVRTRDGGVLIDPDYPDRWLPGFRAQNYGDAPTVNVGAELLKPVVGPLNFRVASYQMAVDCEVSVRAAEVVSACTSLVDREGSIRVLTLNGFNLDTKVEDPSLVNDPRRDVDDDIADGRFRDLGLAIVKDAASPGIVALQEMQDNDGAEQTDVVSARRTYERLALAVVRAGGPKYEWLDIPPESEADGGQPGGNIRNGYLFDPSKVQLVAGSLQLLGTKSPAYEGSRKALVARFRLLDGGGELEVINVHLASKRHQRGLFAPEQPGFDPRLATRVQQAQVIGEHLNELRKQDVDYYVTGDFNDFEFSDTLQVLIGDHSINLIDRVPAPLRFDYNHRGMSQALMHGVVAKRQMATRTAEYEILHTNALLGCQPGRQSTKASDHAYGIARLQLR
ncbi:MAG: putative extracellular nuclease [Planctomycetota bacterium]|jgi:predicted extracellular nuclease